MNTLVIGSVLLGVSLVVALLLICSGEISFLCRLAGGEPVRKTKSAEKSDVDTQLAGPVG